MATKYTLHYAGKAFPLDPAMGQGLRWVLQQVCESGKSVLLDVNAAVPEGSDESAAWDDTEQRTPGKDSGSRVEHFTLLIGPNTPVMLQTTVDVDL